MVCSKYTIVQRLLHWLHTCRHVQSNLFSHHLMVYAKQTSLLVHHNLPVFACLVHLIHVYCPFVNASNKFVRYFCQSKTTYLFSNSNSTTMQIVCNLVFISQFSNGIGKQPVMHCALLWQGRIYHANKFKQGKKPCIRGSIIKYIVLTQAQKHLVAMLFVFGSRHVKFVCKAFVLQNLFQF